jgi:hypothetical protein
MIFQPCNWYHENHKPKKIIYRLIVAKNMLVFIKLKTFENYIYSKEKFKRLKWCFVIMICCQESCKYKINILESGQSQVKIKYSGAWLPPNTGYTAWKFPPRILILYLQLSWQQIMITKHHFNLLNFSLLYM